MNAPIAVFAYRRADQLSVMLRSLQACEGFAAHAVTIFVDGPKGDADRQGVEEVRRLVAGLNLPNVSAVIREENWGLRRSIFQGVDGVCREHGRVIVLEDDLEVAPTALSYFNAALDRYADEPQVWSVVGYMYAAPQLRRRSEAFLLPFTHPWGWATWARAWSHFDLDVAPSAAELRSKAFRTGFNQFGLRNFTGMLHLAERGLIDSWYIRWLYSHYKAGALSVFPPTSYVRNIGVGGGTHASSLNLQSLIGPEQSLADRVFGMPDHVEPDFEALDIIGGSYDARLQNLTSELGRIKRLIRKHRR